MLLESNITIILQGIFMSLLVVSFISPDRPGIVDTLSDLINQHGGNWQTSSLHHLHGLFAGTVEIAIEENLIEKLIEDLQSIPSLKIVSQTTPRKDSQQDNVIVLELTANDRSGIIQEISSKVHKQGGNLMKLVSTTGPAAHTGQDLFKAKMTISINPQDKDTLIDALEGISDDLMIDITH